VTTLPRIHLCGPIAQRGEPARGGYQACNRRTIEGLARAGCEVVALPYPHPHVRGWRKLGAYAAGFLRLYLRLLALPRGSIFHLTALACHFVWNEWPLLRIARLRGCRIVYDLRAGAGQSQYARRGAAYRLAFRACLRAADELLVEGEALVPFIERVAPGRHVTVLPNHLDTDALPRREAAPLPDAPLLAYVGRIVPEKGVEVLLEAAARLRERGLGVDVCIAGDGAAPYVQRLATTTGRGARWLGPLSSAAVLALLRRAHFFVFATRHDGEGQSNALTEAMACGCVPIATRHGFNEAVLGEPELLAPCDATPEDIAARVERLWPARFAELSQRVQSRARERFSTRAVVARLLEVYERAAASDVSRSPSLAAGPRDGP
jgi:glycosyltransferase involved in cell wall biosynthesis